MAQHIHHAGTFFVRLIAYVGDADNLAILHQLGLTLNHLAFVHPVRDGVCNYDVSAFVVNIYRGVGSQHHAAAACGICVTHAVVSVNDAATREIGGFNILHQLLNGDIAVFDIGDTAVKHFTQIVRGHVCGHTHRNTIRSIHQQVGHPGGQHSGLFSLVGVGWHHVHCILFNISHHLVGNLLHAALGVTHGSRAVAINATKVSLTVNHRVSHIPGLGHTDHGKIDRRVAVRVILTQDFTHHGGRFAVGSIVEHAHVVHCKKNSPLHRFQTISDIRQRTRYDYRHCIVNISAFHSSFDIYARYFLVFRNHFYLFILLNYKYKILYSFYF